MGSPRLLGRALSFRLELEDDWTDHHGDITSLLMTADLMEDNWLNGHRGFIPIYHRFEITAVQSTAPGSFWTLLWEHADKVIPFAYAPHGNEEPTPDKPHFTGLVTLPPAPFLGGDAGHRVEQVFATTVPIAQGPIRVTTT